MRLNAEDQQHRDLVLEAQMADNTSDAIRCGLKCAADKARRILTKRGGA